jgi:hypothetical protein
LVLSSKVRVAQNDFNPHRDLCLRAKRTIAAIEEAVKKPSLPEVASQQLAYDIIAAESLRESNGDRKNGH